MTDRGVSVTLSYVLTLAITTLLITGLLTAAGNVVEDRQDSVIRSELRVVGEQVATSLMTADRLAQTTDDTVVVRTYSPDRIGGEEYQLRLDASNEEVVLETTNPDILVRVPFDTETAVSSSSANGGNVEIVLTDVGDLEVRAA